MTADPDARQLRSFGHRCLLMADRIERMQLALEKIVAVGKSAPQSADGLSLYMDALRIAREALQEPGQ